MVGLVYEHVLAKNGLCGFILLFHYRFNLLRTAE